MVDTNSDPRPVDFPIPANDDASSSIVAILDTVVTAVAEGLNERKAEKEKGLIVDEADAEVEAEGDVEVAEEAPVAEAAVEAPAAEEAVEEEAPAAEEGSEEA
jgi:small subunit ribosomal protein S2